MRDVENVVIAGVIAMLVGIFALVLTLGVRVDLPPCSTDDGSDGIDCRWDADRQGDGRGSSFVVIDGVVYVMDEQMGAGE